MRRLKLSIGRLAFVLAVLAIDMAVLRSLGRSTPGSNQLLYTVPIDGNHYIPFPTLALGVLPMASLLVPAAIFQALEFRRSGRISARWLGFLTFGWCSLFLYMTLVSLSPPAVLSFLLGVQGWVGPAISPLITPLLGEEPIQSGTAREWIALAIDGTFDIVLFSLPELALAMAGGWFVGRSRTRVGEPPVAQKSPPRQAFANASAAA